MPARGGEQQGGHPSPGVAVFAALWMTGGAGDTAPCIPMKQVMSRVVARLSTQIDLSSSDIMLTQNFR